MTSDIAPDGPKFPVPGDARGKRDKHGIRLRGPARSGHGDAPVRGQSGLKFAA